MEFRDLKKQYQVLKPQMDAAIGKVLQDCNFISGKQVAELEEKLAQYVGVKHCCRTATSSAANRWPSWRKSWRSMWALSTASPAATAPMR